MGGTYTDSDYRLELTEPETPESFGQHVRSSNLRSVEKRNRILRLRRMGLNHEQIAEALADEDPPIEITPKGVLHAIRRYVEELLAEDVENAEVVRQLEVERLDAMFARVEADVRAGDPHLRQKAIRTQLSIMERRARLLGLDAAQKIEHTGQIEAAAIARPEHVRQIEAEFAGRFDFELPAGEVEELPEQENPESDAA